MEIKSSTKFCHYTSVENARNILSSESIFLNRYDTMNDLVEAKIHKEDSKRVFVLSLCNSNALNIPLFYLYGGIDGKGCRIQFTSAKIRKILNECTVNYVNKQYKQLKKAISPSEYEIIFDWVYYISSNGFCNYRGKWAKVYNSLGDALSTLRSNNCHYFVKNPIWKYENEFRIIVLFKNNIPYERIALNFDIKENEQGISIAFGPETSEKEFEKLSKEFKDYNISKSSKTSDNMVSMDLVSRNKRLLQ